MLHALPVQVKGLQSEYTRLVDSGTGGGEGGSAKAALPVESSAAGGAGSGELPAGEVAELRRLLGEVEQQSSDLQASGAWGACLAGLRADPLFHTTRHRHNALCCVRRSVGRSSDDACCLLLPAAAGAAVQGQRGAGQG
jgi:hypothetical protein